ncbi:hypothetical protein [Asticcacaulis sp. 201]|uniref:hypothetical protein n=1 Tax=Asticcacaulis sp. 201 TaxID=3028787 RepID=UPI00291641F6|nr:hypothetical protein [Asticcacaulis sp. 201]MDV6330614.1 hypothetical protein [Asticcacaulis sp. 201]
MSSPLIEQLITRHGCARLDAAGLDAFISAPGVGALVVTGDPATNLESDDLAVIVPELMKTFPGAFRTGVVDRDLEKEVRHRFDVWATPALIFVESGRMLAALPKVRDWNEYLVEMRRMLDLPSPSLTH